jgi:hypothetical protein
MTVAISNTNLNQSFNTWRTNTNLLSDAMSNNVVTVSRAGSANRGGTAQGNGHIKGTFTANELRTTSLKGGNTTVGSSISISSNATIGGTSLAISANTTFTGNVNFTSVGTDRIVLGDVTRLRVTGGSNNNIMVQNNSDELSFTSNLVVDSVTASANISATNISISGGNVQTLIDGKMSVANTQTLHTSVTANLNSYIANTNPLINDRMQVANTVSLIASSSGEFAVALSIALA